MLRSLIHFWRINVAVILGAAVATSVLTGALLVGDSVQGSLQRLTLGRLGKVDQAILSTRFVREQLGVEIGGTAEVERAAPILSLRASIQNASTGTRVNNVALYGVDERFGAFFDGSPVEDQTNRLRVIHPNEALSKTLGVGVGDAVVLSLEVPSSINREFLFGHDDASERTIRRRVRVGDSAGDDEGARFSFDPQQTIPLVAYVNLDAIQRLLELDGRANAFLLDTDADVADTGKLLAEKIELEDYGLALRDVGPMISLETDAFLLPAALGEVGRLAADTRGLAATGVFTYLANELSAGGRSVPYSTITAIGPWSRRSAPPMFASVSGEPVPVPARGEILLNNHTADRLGSLNNVQVTYYDVESESFAELSETFGNVKTTSIGGIASDRSLTPDFPGLQDADNMADWDAPFPVDLDRVTDVDEAYWDRYGATPKAFISLEDGRRLWSSRFGDLSSIRFHVPPGVDRRFLKAGIRSEMRKTLSPESQGLRIVPLRDQGLNSAQGATDFRGLFFGFSMFLVVSGLAMIAQLFKLGIVDRRREIGLLKALGYRTRDVERRWMIEGIVLGTLGAIIGGVGGVLYAKLMMRGLSTWWVEAVGTRLLTYSGEPLSVLVGTLSGLLLIVWVVRRSVRTQTREDAIGLLKERDAETVVAISRRTHYACVLSTALGICLLVAGTMLDPADAVPVFFGTGACLLIAALSGIRLVAAHASVRSSAGLVLAQVTRFPGRAMASLSLISMAVFVLTAVGLNRHGEVDVSGPYSGTGGFEWVGESTVGFPDLAEDPDDLVDMGFSTREAEQMAGWDLYAFRLKPGEDISCLNLHRPGQPRILGVGRRMIARGGFTFQSAEDAVDPANPWKGLELDLGPGVIPAIGDFNSVQWILHSGLGQEIIVQDELGQPLRLRFVALLKGSVLQSEVMISEKHFVEHFPSIDGYRFLAIDTGAEIGPVESMLEDRLDAFGLDIEAGATKLARYRAVENTYMATFQMIGGLGAVLGTLGVGILMMRNAAERRGELAGMRAIGFSRRRLGGLLFLETAVLILVGVLVGAVAGGMAVAPTVLSHAQAIPWMDLIAPLIGVVLAGCLSGLLTSSVAMRAPIVETLKADR